MAHILFIDLLAWSKRFEEEILRVCLQLDSVWQSIRCCGFYECSSPLGVHDTRLFALLMLIVVSC
jgi:hypothetical protein